MTSRRALLTALPVTLFAGCSRSDRASPTTSDAPASTGTPTDGDPVDATTTRTDAPTDPTGGATTDPTGGATPPTDLDLREANVTGVETSAFDGQVRFDVTLYHDDDGEPGYANWWQVETLDGTRVGRRDLLHAHGTQEFTRSAAFAVPDGASCVVVRGHDETHGYGGVAAVVSPDSGAVAFVEQGPEPRLIAADECP